MDDKAKFLAKAGFRSEVFKYQGIALEIRELSLNERRAVLEASQEDAPTEAIAALTVAMSSPMWDEDSVGQLVESVRPDFLIACAQRVYELSNMVDGAEAVPKAKKPFMKRLKDALSSSWPWHWGKQSHS